MTEREEQAVIVLNTLYNNPLLSDIHRQALEVGIMAIKALPQEPCNDAISRREAIKKIAYNGKGECIPDYDCDNFPVQIAMKTVKKILRELPSIKPQYTDAEIQKMQDLEFAEIQKAYEIGKDEGSSEIPTGWIPVSERLPKTYDTICATIKWDLCDLSSIAFGYYTKDEGWQLVDTEGNRCYDFTVTAWMPLQPYKERSDKE